MENEKTDIDDILDKQLWEAEQQLNIAISNYNAAAKALYLSRMQSQNMLLRFNLANKVRRIKSMNLESF
jgi:hypothetical protein